MPENYWESFLLARETLGGAATLERERVRELAARHREDLNSGGLEREVEIILTRLGELDKLVPGRGPAIREYVLPRLRAELELRTPEMLAGCVEFRTARQQWSPSEQTDAPYRSLMVDVVESVFASTRKTGDWPRQFRSFAARHLATGIEQRFAQLGIEVDAEIAGALLDDAATWELPARPMAEVVQAFRRLVDDDVTFPVPTLATLTSAAEEDSIDKRAAGENDDDIR
jgi:hypothetical protein